MEVLRPCAQGFTQDFEILSRHSPSGQEVGVEGWEEEDFAVEEELLAAGVSVALLFGVLLAELLFGVTAAEDLPVTGVAVAEDVGSSIGWAETSSPDAGVKLQLACIVGRFPLTTLSARMVTLSKPTMAFWSGS